MFKPILEDTPISYAKEKSSIFRNSVREQRWGTPVFFFPPNMPLGDSYRGCGGYEYLYGHPYKKGQAYKGNCTYWCGCRYLELSGITLKAVIGRAIDTYSKYEGRKSGGNLNGQYIGDTIQSGDMLIFADNTALSGDGHIVFVEQVKGNTLYISESAYSKKDIYDGKACITYTLNKSDMKCGNKITLRPSLPYTEILYGVIHTGDVFEEKDYKALYQKAQSKLDRIEAILNE